MDLKKIITVLTISILVIASQFESKAQTNVLYIYGDVDINGWKKFESNYNGTPYHQMRLNNAGQTSGGDNAGTGMSGFKSAVESIPGFTITEMYDQSITLNAAFLSSYDIIILGSNQKTWTIAERDAVNVWVRAGGGVFSYSDSGFGGKYNNPSPAGIDNEQGRDSDNILTEQFGMRFYIDQGGGSGNNVVSSYTIPHPINNNQLNSAASDFVKVEGEGCSPVRIDLNFPGKQSGDAVYQIAKHQRNGSTTSVNGDPDLPNGTNAALNCALAAAEIGSGRVIGYFDRNSFWNSGAGTNINKSGFQHIDFVKNVMTWLSGSSAPTPTASQVRINTGGAGYVSFTGDNFVADTYYTGGQVSSTGATINNTSDQSLYQSERWGNISYDVPVVNDTFDIKLHFAEIYAGVTASGQRVFDVDIEGQTVLNNYDIYADVGFRNATVKTFQVIITDGQIDIDFTGVVDNAKISAIEIMPSSGSSTNPQVGAVVTGELRKWHNVTLTLEGGPNFCENSNPNPFRDFRLDVTFTNGSNSLTIPGYFAADGNAGNTSASCGNKWRVHFSPNATGTWNYTVSFREGTDVAIDANPLAGSAGIYDGLTGSFTTVGTNKSAPDLRAKGLLKYNGTRYLQWSETGELFIKGGTDSPENFLGYYEFDNTSDNGGASNDLTGAPHYDGLHHYDPHLNDWNSGDPQWKGSQGRRIIGAINYLASEGINSLYSITMNVNGDGREVYPWTSYNERFRFDVSKLDQWEIVFDHMERNGIAMHVLTQETENDQLLNGGNLGNERKLYYRELVARFGHHNAINWNLGEECTNSTQQIKDFATYFKDIDPYDHFISVHTYPGQQNAVYTPLLGYPDIDGASIQTNLGSMPNMTETWIDNSGNSSRQWVINGDEVGPYYDGVKPDGGGNNHDAVREDLVWGNIMQGGGGSELYFGYNHAHNDLDCEDFRSRNSMWDFVRNATEFAETHIPLSEVDNFDGLGNNPSNHILAKKGDKYIIYIDDANGTATINLETHVGPFYVGWYDPRIGGSLQTGSTANITGPGTRNLGTPPGGSTTNDWVVVLTNHNTGFNSTILSDDVSCFNGNDGQATGYGVNGPNPHTYLWSTGSTNQAITGLTPNVYTVTVTDNSGATSTSSTTIGEPLPVAISENVNDETCTGNDGSITVSANGGSGNYSFLWSDGSTNTTLGNVAAGNYTVTATDITGCTSQKTITVAFNQTSANFSISNVNTEETCLGNDGAIDITPSGGTAPYTFMWSNGLTTEDISGIAAGSYTVTITDQTGCADIEVVNLTFDAANANFAVDSTIVSASCGSSDGAISLNVAGGTGPYNYIWSGSGGPLGACDEFSEQSGMVHVECESATIIPSWTEESSVSGYTDTGYLEWKNGNNSTGVDAAGTGAITYLIHVTTTGRYRFLIRSASPAATDHNDVWARFPDNGALAIKGATTNSLGTGWFKVYQNNSGNNWTWNTSTVDNDPHEIHADFNTPGTYRVELSGRSTLFKVDRFTLFHSSVSYATATNTGIPQSSFGVCSEDSLGGLSAGIYTVQITDANGCSAVESFTVPLDTNSVPYSLGANVIGESCAGNDGSVNLTISNGGGSGPFNYLWSNGATTEDISSVASGTYTVTVQDNSGCESVSSYTVTSSGGSGNFQTTETVVDESCLLGNDGSINLVVNSGTGTFTYLWSNGATVSNISNLSAGNYNVTITDQNGCTDQEVYNIVTTPGPGSFAITASTVGQNCQSTDGAIDLSVSGGLPGYTYNWSNGATSEDINNLAAGSYTVTITDQKGCFSDKIFNVVGIPGPTNYSLSTIDTAESCFGNDASVYMNIGSGNGPFTYLWSTGKVTQNLTNIAAGIYTVTVTDATGCYDELTTVIGQQTGEYDFGVTSSIVDEGCSGGDGSIDLSLSNGTPNLSYVWSNGATTEDISGIGSGTYTITITDISGCYMDSVFVVGFDNNNTNYNLSEIVLGETCNLNDANIDLTVVGGTAPYTYSWSNGASTEDLSSVSAGSYSVLIVDANNCATTRQVTIPFIPGPATLNVSETTVDESCAVGADGEINLNSITGGTAGYSFIWSTGATTQNVASLSAGAYSVTITDQNGCYDFANYTLSIAPGVANFPTVDDIQNEGCSAIDGAIDITPVGGLAPYNFVWSNGATSEDISGLVAGSYSVTITDDNGCFDTENYIVLFDSTNGNFNLAENIIGESCGVGDASIALNVSGGIAPYSYSWSGGETTNFIGSLTAGTYSVMIVDSINCVTNKTITVPFNVGPVALSVSETITDETCLTGTDGLINVSSVTGGTPGYTYLWSNGETASSVSNLGAGAYTLTIYDLNGCYQSSLYNVNLAPGPAAFPTTDSIVSEGCATLNGLIDITPSGGSGAYTYLWSDGSSTEDLINITAGNYTVTITDTDGCYDTESYTVNFDASDGNFTFAETVADAGCDNNDGAIDITVAGGNGAYTYAWSNGASTEDLSNVPAGTYTVIATDALGCTSTRTYSIDTIVGATDFLPTEILTNETCATGSDGSIDVTLGSAGNFTFAWSNGATTEDLNSISNGTYDLTVTNEVGCFQNLTYNVNIIAGIRAMNTNEVITDESCNGNDGGIVVSPAGGTAPYAYSWSTASTTSSTSNLSAGTYFLILTDANGCYDNKTYSVGFSGGQTTFNVGRTISNATCQGSDGAVDIAVSGGVFPYTYLWSTGATTQDIVNVPSGTYTVSVTDARGCFSTENFTLTQNVGQTTFNLANFIVQPSCLNSNGIIFQSIGGGNPPFTYLWSNGATTKDVNGLSQGTYSVTITDDNGCYMDTSYSLTIIPGQTSFNVVRNIANESCNGNDGSITMSVTGGVPPYTYAWSNGTTTQDLNNVSAGTYTITITDAAGCYNVRTYNVVFAPGQSSAIVSSAGVTSSTCALNDGAVNITPNGGTSPYSYVWSNGATSQSITNLNTGTYTVTVADQNGCYNIFSYFVPIDTTSAANYQVNSSVVNESCLLNDGSIILNTIFGGTGNFSFLWSNGATVQNPGGLSAGVYNLTIFDQNGCSGNSFYIVGFDATNANFLVLDSLINEACGQNDGLISLNVSGGSGFYSYQWSSGDTTAIASGLNAGTYNVTIADTNGCAMQQSYSIVNVPGPITPVISQLQDTLISSQASNYQWYVNGSLIPGATGQTHSYTQTGYYYVQISDNRGCFATSDSIMVTVIGISDLGPDADVNVYPNPFNDYLDVAFNSVKGNNAILRIDNMLGQMVFYKEINADLFEHRLRIDLNNLNTGLYLLSIETEDQRSVKRIVKQ